MGWTMIEKPYYVYNFAEKGAFLNSLAGLFIAFLLVNVSLTLSSCAYVFCVLVVFYSVCSALEDISDAGISLPRTGTSFVVIRLCLTLTTPLRVVSRRSPHPSVLHLFVSFPVAVSSRRQMRIVPGFRGLSR